MSASWLAANQCPKKATISNFLVRVPLETGRVPLHAFPLPSPEKYFPHFLKHPFIQVGVERSGLTTTSRAIVH